MKRGQICAYGETGDAATETAELGWYVCLATDADHSVWHKYDSYVGLSACPLEQPEQGDPCTVSSKEMFDCVYPGAAGCKCERHGSSSAWRCVSVGDPPRKRPPSSAKPITELTDDERRAWCEWYICQGANGGDAVPQTPSEDGYVSPSSCIGPFVGLVAQNLSLENCIGNLAVSTCQATEADLSDCALSVVYPAITSCGIYLATPGCSGTIAVAGHFTRRGDPDGFSNCPPLKVR